MAASGVQIMCGVYLAVTCVYVWVIQLNVFFSLGTVTFGHWSFRKVIHFHEHIYSFIGGTCHLCAGRWNKDNFGNLLNYWGLGIFG